MAKRKIPVVQHTRRKPTGGTTTVQRHERKIDNIPANPFNNIKISENRSFVRPKDNWYVDWDSTKRPEKLPERWHESINNVNEGANILNDIGYFMTPEDVIHYFEKPWHYGEDVEKAMLSNWLWDESKSLDKRAKEIEVEAEKTKDFENKKYLKEDVEWLKNHAKKYKDEWDKITL